MTPVISPITYEVVKEALSDRFVSNLGPLMWIQARENDDFYYVWGESTKIGTLEPSGLFTLEVEKGLLANESFIRHAMSTVGIGSMELIKSTNFEPTLQLSGHKEAANGTTIYVVKHHIKHMDLRCVGTIPDITTYDKNNVQPWNLGLELLIPESYTPRELPKVPRKIIAQLREHVEKHYDLAKIQMKLLGTKYSRYDVNDPNKVPDEDIRDALGYKKDPEKRGKLMCGNNALFWRYAFGCYRTPASLIDSCRSEFYDAAGVRGIDANTTLNLSPGDQIEPSEVELC